jgi:hypothetical protein
MAILEGILRLLEKEGLPGFKEAINYFKVPLQNS